MDAETKHRRCIRGCTINSRFTFANGEFIRFRQEIFRGCERGFHSEFYHCSARGDGEMQRKGIRLILAAEDSAQVAPNGRRRATEIHRREGNRVPLDYGVFVKCHLDCRVQE